MADANEEEATVAMTEEEMTIQALNWIGFTQVQSEAIADDIGFLSDIRDMTEKQMESVMEQFSKRTVAQGRIHAGARKGKLLNSLIHFLQDQRKLGVPGPTIDGYDDGGAFIDALKRSMTRAMIRKEAKETMDTRAKQAAPTKLKGEKDFVEWESAMLNYLSILRGVQGVPLSYVIRRDDDEAVDDDIDPNAFDQLCIARCPLEGEYFDADNQQVHQIITSYVTGENPEEWIKGIRKHKNGRMDMEQLRSHYRGESNTVKTIQEAESLKSKLHYRNESAMPFQTFLNKCQRMFTLFDQAGEPFMPSQKVRFLLERCADSTNLSAEVGRIKLRTKEEPESFDFLKAANFLAAEVPSSKGIGRATLNAVGVDLDQGGIYKDGAIFTGYIPHWKKLSKTDREAVDAERVRKGEKQPGQANGSGNNNKGQKGKSKYQKQIKALQKKEAAYKAEIKALKRKSDDGDDESDAETVPTGNAGNGFGGRREMETKKAKKSK